MTTIEVLGPLRVDGRAVSGPRDRVVLAALASQRGKAFHADELAEALWGDTPPASATKVIQGCIARLRKLIGSESIETTANGYLLVVGDDDLDIRRFERLLLRGRELLSLGQPDRAAHVLSDAQSLWSGDPLSEVEDWDHGRIEAERLRALLAEAEELGVEAAIRAGQHRDVLVEAQRLVAQEPLREQRWGLLARAEYQSGRQAESLRTLRRARAHLAAEVGLELSPELAALEDAILNQDPDLKVDAIEVEPTTACPYPGLVAYGLADREGFFGREREIEDCRRRLRSGSFVAVLGPSGSGKSSLVRAGVAASLAADGHRVVVTTPGRRPLDALSGLDENAVLIVDQFEEAVTLCEDVDERLAFFDRVVAMAEVRGVVIALRADRLGEVSAHPGLAGLLEGGLFLVRAMDGEGLRAAIEGPARQAGLLLEPGLVELLLGEIEGRPGALPLLSHSLRETWEQREGRTLTVAGYRNTGGIASAVAQSAERLFASFERHLQPVVQDLLVRLVVPSDDREPVRAPIPARGLSQDLARGPVIERLVDARLVTADDDKIELAHEALATAWPRFRTWLDEDVEGHRIRRHLTVASEEWDRLGQPASELYRGVRLAAAVEWAERAEVALAEPEAEFLATSRELAEREEMTAKRRAAEQARRNRHLRVLLAGAVALLIVAIGAGLLLVRERDRAAREATGADARRLGAQALVAEDLDRSLLLAAEGVRLDNSGDTRVNLRAALTRNPFAVASHRAETARWSLEPTPDGGRLFASGVGELQAIRTEDLSIDMAVEFQGAAMALSPAGDVLAVANPYWNPSGAPELDGTPIRLFDPASLGELAPLPGQPADGASQTLAFGWPGGRLAAGFERYPPGSNIPSGGYVAVWDLDDPGRPPTIIDIPLASATADGVALSPDEATVYVASVFPPESQLMAFDVETGRMLDSVDTEPAPASVEPLGISPDGSLLAVAEGVDVVVRQSSDLSEVVRLDGHIARVHNPTFSNDGTRIATASEDATVKVWQAGDGQMIFDFDGHSSATRGVAFSPDDELLHSAGLDQAILTWDLRGRRWFAPLVADASVRSAREPGRYFGSEAKPSHDGKMVAYPQQRLEDGQPVEAGVQLVDLVSGEVTEWLDTGHEIYGDVAWHPDGDRFVTAGTDGHVRVWRVGADEPALSREVADGHIAGIDVGAEGDLIFVGERSGRLSALDSQTLDPVGQPVTIEGRVVWLLAGPQSLVVALTADGFAVVDLEARETVFEDDSYAVWGAGISPDGTRVAIGTGTGEVGLVDTEAREWIVAPDERTAHRAGTTTLIDFSPDGTRYATGSRDGRIVIWDSNIGEPTTILPEMFGQFAEPWFSADGDAVLVSAFQRLEPGIFRWNLDPDSDLAAACTIAGRNLTDTEWAEFLGTRPYRETCPTSE